MGYHGAIMATPRCHVGHGASDGYRRWLLRGASVIDETWCIPSGKLLHSYGTSPFLMGKSTINGHFQ